MFLWSWHKLVLYYATYIIINIKTLIKSKNKKHIKYNNPNTIPLSEWYLNFLGKISS